MAILGKRKAKTPSTTILLKCEETESETVAPRPTPSWDHWFPPSDPGESSAQGPVAPPRLRSPIFVLIPRATFNSRARRQKSTSIAPVLKPTGIPGFTHLTRANLSATTPSQFWMMELVFSAFPIMILLAKDRSDGTPVPKRGLTILTGIRR
jgi:hypothetical protein